jgi:hypothetical protein
MIEDSNNRVTSLFYWIPSLVNIQFKEIRVIVKKKYFFLKFKFSMRKEIKKLKLMETVSILIPLEFTIP